MDRRLYEKIERKRSAERMIQQVRQREACLPLAREKEKELEKTEGVRGKKGREGVASSKMTLTNRLGGGSRASNLLSEISQTVDYNVGP